MDERRRRLLGPSADDADVRGEHQYPDVVSGSSRTSSADTDEALTRDPDQYAAGAEGTQRITTGARKR